MFENVTHKNVFKFNINLLATKMKYFYLLLKLLFNSLNLEVLENISANQSNRKVPKVAVIFVSIPNSPHSCLGFVGNTFCLGRGNDQTLILFANTNCLRLRKQALDIELCFVFCGRYGPLPHLLHWGSNVQQK